MKEETKLVVAVSQRKKEEYAADVHEEEFTYHLVKFCVGKYEGGKL